MDEEVTRKMLSEALAAIKRFDIGEELMHTAYTPEKLQELADRYQVPITCPHTGIVYHPDGKKREPDAVHGRFEGTRNTPVQSPDQPATSANPAGNSGPYADPGDIC